MEPSFESSIDLRRAGGLGRENLKKTMNESLAASGSIQGTNHSKS